VVTIKESDNQHPGDEPGGDTAHAPINLNRAIERSLVGIRTLIGNEVELIWRPSERPGMVRLEPLQLNRVLSSLATTARKALDGHGRIVIETDIEDCSDTDSGFGDSVPSGTYVVLALGYSGLHTVNDVSAKSGELAEPGAIIKQNHGFITVNTHPGQGSVFRILLPPGEIPLPAATPPVTRPVRSEAVLLVEDEWSIAAPIKLFLEKAGYTVAVAYSPNEAIQQIETAGHPFDLLLTDVIMPGMNGRTLYHILRQKHPTLQCIFMSGYTAETLDGTGDEEALVNFIHKPFSRDELLQTVRSVLDQS
jgi:CheY-like chemotaxis protein